MEPVLAFTAVVLAAVATAAVMHFDEVERRVLATSQAAPRTTPVLLEYATVSRSATEDVARLLAGATAEVGGLAAIEASWFEPFPFPSQLPRLLPGRLQLPAAEPGTAVSTEVRRGSGFEVPVFVRGLPVGRLVVVPHTDFDVLGLDESTRDSVLGIAGRLGAALGVQWESADPVIFTEVKEED